MAVHPPDEPTRPVTAEEIAGRQRAEAEEAAHEAWVEERDRRRQAVDRARWALTGDGGARETVAVALAGDDDAALAEAVGRLVTVERVFEAREQHLTDHERSR